MDNSIVFVTTCNADWGKLKPLYDVMADSCDFNVKLFIYGNHVNIKDFKNAYTCPYDYAETRISAYGNIANVFNDFLSQHTDIKYVVVHGDRLEPLSCTIVAKMHHLKVIHIESGDVSGSIDNDIRYSIERFSDYFFASNEVSLKNAIARNQGIKPCFNIGFPDNILKYRIEETKNDEKYVIVAYNKDCYLDDSKTIEELETIKNILTKFEDTYDKVLVMNTNNDDEHSLIRQFWKIYSVENKKVQCFNEYISQEKYVNLVYNCEFFIGNSSSIIYENTLLGVRSILIGRRQINRFDNIFTPEILIPSFVYECGVDDINYKSIYYTITLDKTLINNDKVCKCFIKEYDKTFLKYFKNVIMHD